MDLVRAVGREFDASETQTEGRVVVSVSEPPNAVARGFGQSHFANGATAGIESVYGRKVKLAASDYDESGRRLSLVFGTSATRKS
ncbi:MAG: hypothetical protein JRM80_13400 [Nitrososphaerota archaeon]|nr:hypothetical protein [Nitrososphaerota archaeon]